jgi:hypothetical protein
MHLTENVIEGTIKPDGTVELDQKPSLSPGRVTVILRQEAQKPGAQGGWWSVMQSARQSMEAAGCRFLDENELQAHIDSLREEDRIDELLRELDAARPKPE